MIPHHEKDVASIKNVEIERAIREIKETEEIEFIYK